MDNILEKVTPIEKSRDSIETDLIKMLERRFGEVKVFVDGEAKKVSFTTDENKEVTVAINEIVDHFLNNFTTYDVLDVRSVFEEEEEKKKKWKLPWSR